jgi:nitrous oxidase accessory protein NosD
MSPRTVLAIASLPIASLAFATPPVEIVVDRDDVIVTTSCRLRIADGPIADRNGDGVVRIVAEGILVEIGGTLRGAPPDADPDTFSGIGIVVAAPNVTLANGGVSGFKVGVKVEEADGATIANLDLSDNFATRLRSTPEREAVEDWLRPHENDDGEWADRYGAGLLVRDSDDVTIRDLFVRRTQNGILLDRVERARIHDNDCSFLSGWGLALWRSSFNRIARNAFDFCVRGYSHGVYNRGQDSAGILLFEQCTDNVIAFNSATHGGDGIFAFAGREALGEVSRRDDSEPTDGDVGWHLGRGNTRNVLLGNDVSHAVAHGIETTFSRGVVIAGNRMDGCGICGVWAGYGSDSLIVDNDFVGNGRLGYGAERGGVNIEHGRGNRILANRFRDNACGVRLWWDEDPHLATLPWSAANGTESRDEVVARNLFDGDEIAIELLRTEAAVVAGNRFTDVGTELVADDASRSTLREGPEPAMAPEVDLEVLAQNLPGRGTPIGARSKLAGRERIVMTEWGPYAWDRPLLSVVDRSMAKDRYRLLGAEATGAQVLGAGSLRTLLRGDGTVEVICERPGRVCPYRLRVSHDRGRFETEGLLAPANWTVRLFRSPTDPRDDPKRWRAAADAEIATLLENGGALVTVPAIEFDFGMSGPAAVPSLAADASARAMPADGFGLVAETTLVFPPGRWRLRTVSDDGIRLLRDGEILFERWDRHAATADIAEFALAEETSVDLRIEWFELDGAATLSFDVERLGD